MKKPGRPNYKSRDLPIILSMIERWRPGTSTSSLATFELEIMINAEKYPHELHSAIRNNFNSGKALLKKQLNRTQLSTSKRLEKSFNELSVQEQVLPISIYLERKVALYRGKFRGEADVNNYANHCVASAFDKNPGEINEIAEQGLAAHKLLLEKHPNGDDVV